MKRIRVAFSVAALAIVLYSPALGGQSSFGLIQAANGLTLCPDGSIAPCRQVVERRPSPTIAPRPFPNSIIQPVAPRLAPTYIYNYYYTTPRLQTPSQRRQPIRTTPQRLTSPNKLPPVTRKPSTSQFTPTSNSAGQGMDPAMILGLIALFGGVMFYIGHRSSRLATQSAFGSRSSQQIDRRNGSDGEDSVPTREAPDR
jgi:hypothetical protein